MALFSEADLPLSRSSAVNYTAKINDPRIASVRILRPQEIPHYVEEGTFDFGITGRDWVEETRSNVVSLGELPYSKQTTNPIKVVLAVSQQSGYESVADLPQGVRVSTEYPALTKDFFERNGIEADVQLSYGATEAKVPDIADGIVEISETGSALKAAGLKIIETIFVSYTELIACPQTCEDPEKLHAMRQIYSLLTGVLEARGNALLKMNVPNDCLESVIAILPAMQVPTVNKLFNEEGFAVETVAPKAEINLLIPALKDAGARDIVEFAISKIVA